jgi:hypothetical protein
LTKIYRVRIEELKRRLHRETTTKNVIPLSTQESYQPKLKRRKLGTFNSDEEDGEEIEHSHNAFQNPTKNEAVTNSNSHSPSGPMKKRMRSRFTETIVAKEMSQSNGYSLPLSLSLFT